VKHTLELGFTYRDYATGTVPIASMIYYWSRLKQVTMFMIFLKLVWDYCKAMIYIIIEKNGSTFKSLVIIGLGKNDLLSYWACEISDLLGPWIIQKSKPTLIMKN